MLDKRSKKDDQVANLYRAALLLARGDELGWQFLAKTSFLMPRKRPRKVRDRLVLAERVLDEYRRKVIRTG